MPSHRLLAFSLCALAPLFAAGCAKSTSEANANNARAVSASTSTGAAQTTAGQANVPAQAAQANAPGGQTASPASNAAGAAGAQKLDACALLTSDEIEAVQGEAVKDTKASGRDDAPLSVSQCFFTTATFSKSVSLEVTRGVSGGKGAREFWDRQFARAREEGGKGDREREREREREKKKTEGRGGEEEEEGSLPVPVKGVGDEAFWAASNVNGTLYARKGDAFVRVSIGGTDKQEARLRKVKTLAQKALARL